MAEGTPTDESHQRAHTVAKYVLLMNTISKLEDRLARSEIAYLAICLLVFVSSTASINRERFFGYPYLLFWLVIGMFVCSFWTASALRIQLKLKLRYFQARVLERKMNAAGESFCCDEDRFFDPAIRRIESFDGQDVLRYPRSGLKGMDGLVGAAKPRYMSWILPGLFFVLYIVTWFYFVFSES